VDLWNRFIGSGENQKFSIFQVLHERHEEADVIVGIKIIGDNDDIRLSQSHYIKKVLWKFKYLDWSPVATPFDPSYALTQNSVRPIVQLKYIMV